MKKGSFGRLLVGVGASALAIPCGANVALAQDMVSTAADVGDDLPADIVVTAQRREQRLQDTPISITAFDSVALESRGLTNIQDLATYAPNVNITQTNRPGGGSSAIAAYIRGVGSGDYQFPLDPAVGVYVDGIYLARTSGGLMEVVDIERIEVLKGPQGTLFGRNTVGGAISITTKRPRLSGPATGGIELRAGNFGRKDVLANINAPLVEGVLGGKFAFGLITRDGYGYRPYADDYAGGSNRVVMRGALSWAATDALTVDLNGDFSMQRGTPRPTVGSRVLPLVALVNRYNALVVPGLNARLGLPADSRVDLRFNPTGFYDSAGTNEIRDDYDVGGVNLTMNYDLGGGFALKTITAWRSLRTSVSNDPDATPYPILETAEQITDTQFSQEIQLTGSAIDDRLKILIGAYAFREDGTRRQTQRNYFGLYQATGLAADARNTATFNDFMGRSYSVFSQLEFELLPKLALVGGLRYTYDEKVLQQEIRFTEINGFQVAPRTLGGDWTKLTPKVGVNFTPSRDLLLYGSYSVGYKSGGFNPNGTNPNFPDPAFRPEELETFELGFKSQFLDRRVTLNAAAFMSEYRDVQLTVVQPVSGVNVRTIQNAGRASLHGFEVDLSVRPARGFALNASVGYLHNEFKELTPQAIGAGITVGSGLAQVPRWTLNVGADYTFDTQAGEFALHADVGRQSDMLMTIADPQSLQRAYAMINARIAWKPAFAPGVELSVQGQNLGNVKYDLYRQFQAGGNQLSRVPGSPRTVFGALRYSF